MSTREQDIIEDVITDIYGEDPFVQAGAEHITQQVNMLLDEDEDIHSPRLLQRVTNVIWNFFPGGSTAQSAAERVIAALIEAGVC